MERFGLSPALYMKIQRLNGARHDLSGEHEPSRAFLMSQTNGGSGTWVNLPGTTEAGFANFLWRPTKGTIQPRRSE